jgi:hypothetical protein
MDDLDNGPVDARVAADDQQAADEAEDGQRQAGAIASAAAPLVITGRSEHDRAPAAQQARLARAAALVTGASAMKDPLPSACRSQE